MVLLAALLVFSGSAWAQDYNHVTVDVFKDWLEGKHSMHIVDIQPEKEFAAKHFAGSISTAAFPVETDEQRARLDKGAEAYAKDNRDVVIICPRGKKGAQRTYDYLKSKGVLENRLFILAGGMASWPHDALLIKEKQN
ncbi:MAG: hypothetical protein BWK76_12080 [Desulfobulbaceae bacterium A2]|nr:MAG: hypothetical protein BWK76_12080 [Desulfobulbaceae bacterium A2]